MGEPGSGCDERELTTGRDIAMDGEMGVWKDVLAGGTGMGMGMDKGKEEWRVDCGTD